MPQFAVKDLFFDRQKVIDAMDAASKIALSKAGAFIRTTAQRSMPKRKKSAAPGKPPSSHQGNLRKLIYFSYDPRSKSVVVGPTKFNDGTVPHLMEFGGTAKVTHKGKSQTAKYQPHPFMGPALTKEQANLPARWKI